MKVTITFNYLPGLLPKIIIINRAVINAAHVVVKVPKPSAGNILGLFCICVGWFRPKFAFCKGWKFLTDTKIDLSVLNNYDRCLFR